MIAIPLGAACVDEALRVTRALGAHRYVAGRAHHVHALAFAALGDADGDGDAAAVAPGREWARGLLASASVDAGSRDEALFRRCSEAEVAAVLEAYWRPGPAARAARDRLRSLLASFECPPASGPPFDEAVEGDMHPVLVDAGWELVRLSDLDADRHKGAIAAFGSAMAFESARFEEETAIPRPVYLCELPAIGAAELLGGADDDGVLAEPLVAWVDGNETYVDYVIRGVRRAAKIAEPDGDGR